MFEALGIDWLKLAAQLVNFLLLLYLLNRFLFRPLLARMDERSAKIQQGLEDAAAAARDRELASAEREAAVAEARREASDMIARATKIAEDTRNEILEEARADAERVSARAREEIVAEKEKAMAEIRSEVADLALIAAGKLIRREMDATTQRRLVEEFLADVQPAATDGRGRS